MEDMRIWYEDGLGMPSPHSPKCWGAATNNLLRWHVLKRTGERRACQLPRSHGDYTDVYRLIERRGLQIRKLLSDE